MTKRPSAARTCPRSRSSTSPEASTTVRRRTQSRVVPCLNVAAPAALVDTTPPTVAPSNVGTGGYALPAASRTSRRVVRATPGCTVIRSFSRSPTAFILDVLSTSSPIGVAPPVRDDCAPTGRTRAALRTSEAHSVSSRGNAAAGAWPPG